jgi:hypothetical protein
MSVTTEEAELQRHHLEEVRLLSLAAERDALQAKNARLHEAVKMARECLEDRDVIGANLTLEKAIGEKE